MHSSEFGVNEYRFLTPNTELITPNYYQAKASVKSFSLNILRFQVEIWGTT